MMEDNCPCCGFHVYRGSYKGTPVYKCANPMSKCEWNQEWHKEKGNDYYRMPLGKTKAQVRRVNAEFENHTEKAAEEHTMDNNESLGDAIYGLFPDPVADCVKEVREFRRRYEEEHTDG